MKVSRNWLQTFFDTALPAASELEALLTFHSSEIDEVVTVGDDSVLDVKVLPDRAAWLLSHRGVAKEISVITGTPLSRDPFLSPVSLLPVASALVLELDTPTCDYYAAALVTNVAVGPSPEWLKTRLAAIGQRSINNVVDATNYIMFELGQPLHAFDAGKLMQQEGVYRMGVRSAYEGEAIITLTGEAYTLTSGEAIIVDQSTDTPIGIAGIKGGKVAAVDVTTTSLVIEAAHFDRVMIRNSTKRLRLATDASKRYENGISKGVAPIALEAIVALILDVAGGELVGYQVAGEAVVVRAAVTVPLARINSILGLTLTDTDLKTIFNNFGYEYSLGKEALTVVPPFERDDLVIAEDVIEEIGRMYGLDQIVSVPPIPQPVAAFNARHYFAETVRTTLTSLGFSEIYTSSFRSKDVVHIKNALASDKSYLRSSLHENIREAVSKNVPHRDLLGLSAIKVFEIGTVFGSESEAVHVGLGVQSGTSYKAKLDDPLLAAAQGAVALALGTPLSWLKTESGISELSLDDTVAGLPRPIAYVNTASTATVSPYQPFSLYPSVTRDIAVWVPVATTAGEVESLLLASAGSLCVRVTLFDTFIKDDKTSLGFRLVFQAKEKTLAASEVDEHMNAVYAAAAKAGWEAR